MNVALRMCVVAAAILLASGSQPIETHAQRADSISASVWQFATRNYWHVRLTVAEGDTIEGRVQYFRGQASIGTVAVPDSYIQLDRRLSRGRGMYVGAGIGALIGGVLVGAFAASMSEGGDGVNAAALGGAGAGAMLGMLGGHLAAPAHHEWIRIWP